MLSNVPGGLVCFDDERRIADVNDEAARALGYDARELVGQTLNVVLPPAVRIFFSTYVYPVLAARGRAEEVYTLLRCKDGEELPVLFNAARRDQAERHVTDCVFLVVKRRNLLERQLHGLGERPVEPVAASELSDRLALLGTLLAGVMHEIRNPLTYVTSSLEVLADELGRPLLDSNLARECVADLRDGVERIHGLVEAVGLVSRVSPSSERRFDCADVIAAAVRLVRPRIPAGVEMKVEPGANAIIKGDQARLAQVLMNLLVNAGQAIRSEPSARGQVQVCALVQGDQVIIEVRDNGPGVPEALRERIFDAFYTTKPVGEGTGLGLPISRQIVESFGGTLTLVSSEVGATFRVTLPCSAP